MDAPNRDVEVDQEFDRLCELSPAERARELERLGDAGLRERLVGLLRHFDQDDAELPTIRELQRSIPQQVGPYSIEKPLGEGGMGVVYLAREPRRESPLALKVLRHDFDSDHLRKRFRNEAKVLQRLSHPGIAELYDTGEALVGGTQLPYIAMEYVPGSTLVEHAERRALDDAGRIELLARLCDALEHAHVQGVVHRDLKPSNVLVHEGADGIGQPKVLDFGVARVIDEALVTMTRTRSGIMIGTAAYMSPEQASGRHADTGPRSDVYSLGVLCFELLTGQLPYSVIGLPPALVARAIEEEEPSRLGSISERLRGPLEWIVARALEKNPRERYESAAALASDLRRFARGEAVQARPTSMMRRVRKLARRHRLLAGALMGTFVALTIGMATTSWFAFGQWEARRAADENATQAKRSLYRATLRAAEVALAEGDAAIAELELAAAPEEVRGWEWHLLAARVDESILRIESGWTVDPPDARLEFGDDGRSLVVAFRKRARAWDVATGALLGALSDTRGLLLDERGQHVQWSEERGVLEFAALGAEPDVSRLELTLDSAESESEPELLFASPELALVQTRDSLQRIDLRAGTTRTLTNTLSPAGRASTDRAARWVARPFLERGFGVWDLETGGSWRLCEDQYSTRHARVSPDGRRVAYSYDDGRIGQWRLDPEQGPVLEHRIDSHPGGTYALRYSPSSRWLASAGEDRSVRVSDVETGELLWCFSGHRAEVRELAFSPDESLLASLDASGVLLVWALEPDPRVLDLGRWVNAAEFAPSGERIYIGTAEGELRVFDARSLEEIGRLKVDTAFVRRLDIDPTGTLAAVTCTGSVPWGDRSYVVDLESGATLRDFTLPTDPADLPRGRGPQRDFHRQRAMVSTFAPDGTQLAVAWGDGRIELRDTQTWQTLRTREAPQATHDSPAQARTPYLAYDPEGRWMAVAGEDRIELLDARTLEPQGAVDFPTQGLELAFDPSGQWLASASLTARTPVWRMPDFEPVAEPAGHAGLVYGVAWSLGGERLFTAGKDFAVKVWDTRSWDELATLRGHRDYVYSVRVSPDGEALLTCSGDGTARLWSPLELSELRAEREAYRDRARELAPLIDELEPLSVAAAHEQLDERDELDERGREIAEQLLLARRLAQALDG